MSHRVVHHHGLSLRTLSFTAVALLGLFAPLSACGSDDPSEDGDASGGTGGSTGGSSATGGSATGGSGGSIEPSAAHCQAIGSLCHAADDGDGPIAACHDLGHEGDPAACAAGFDDCVTLCLGASGGDGGATGGGSALCTFIGSICHEVDDGDGPLHACHELGHSGDPVACEEQAESCVVMCVEAAQGAGGAAGSGS